MKPTFQVVKICKEAVYIITDYGYNPVIIVDGAFKGIIGVITSVEMSYYDESTCEINIDYRNTITVNCNQIAPLRDMSIFAEYGINIFNKDGTIKNVFEIIKNMEEKNIMPTKSFNLGLMGISNVRFFTIEHQIVDVNIIVPDKVVEVIFADGTKEKSVCREPDTFSLESAISICISKKIMGGSSAYNNAVKRGMKVYEDKQKREAAEKAEQERIEKKRAKRLAYKERRAVKRTEEEKQRKAKEREEQIVIQTEAYLRAMKAMDDFKNVVVNEENN